MEQSPPQEPNSGNDEPQDLQPIRELIQPTLDELERREREAQMRDERLRTAIDRLTEVRSAAARDHSFDDEYQQAIDRVAELLQEEQAAGRPESRGDEPSDS